LAGAIDANGYLIWDSGTIIASKALNGSSLAVALVPPVTMAVFISMPHPRHILDSMAYLAATYESAYSAIRAYYIRTDRGVYEFLKMGTASSASWNL
jgi:hypothetical protein